MKKRIERIATGLVWSTSIALLGPEAGRAFVEAKVEPDTAMNIALRALSN